ncbi:hypothetical protein [Oceanibaculum nanhaiense]|uniref:hypothetical protein n=1 Tax=Oceanibaculum nanhaiense TaxID=1909734 RepID=UPI003D29CDEE
MHLPERSVRWLHRLLLRRIAGRKPDQIIGGEDNPYLIRWCLIRKNRWFNIYLHHTIRSDDDRALHDHPWHNVSLLLDGGYIEIMPAYPDTWPHSADLRHVSREVGALVLRRAVAAHRLALWCDDEGIELPSWSLFITGPHLRRWGFWCFNGTSPRWVYWRNFTDDTGLGVGKGCG